MTGPAVPAAGSPVTPMTQRDVVEPVAASPPADFIAQPIAQPAIEPAATAQAAAKDAAPALPAPWDLPPPPEPAADFLPEIGASPAPPPRPSLDRLRATLADARCLLAEVEDLGGKLLVSGTAAGESSAAAARTAVELAAGGWAIGFDLAVAGAHLCEPLSVIGGALAQGRAAGAESVALKPGADMLRAGEPLTVEVAAPADRAVHVRLDYFTTDGMVVHLLPNPSDIDDRIEAGATRRLGERGTGGRSWSIGPPFGHELLIVLAGPARLFARPRPEVESAAVYLGDLKTALNTAAGPVQASARFIVTAP